MELNSRQQKARKVFDGIKTAPQEGASDNSSKQEQEPRSGRASEGIAEIILHEEISPGMAEVGQLNVSLESAISFSPYNIKALLSPIQDPMGANLKIHHPQECDLPH